MKIILKENRVLKSIISESYKEEWDIQIEASHKRSSVTYTVIQNKVVIEWNIIVIVQHWNIFLIFYPSIDSNRVRILTVLLNCNSFDFTGIFTQMFAKEIKIQKVLI